MHSRIANIRRPAAQQAVGEALAAKYPCQDIVEHWTQARLPEGSPARP